MSEPDRDRTPETDVRYDNWPIEREPRVDESVEGGAEPTVTEDTEEISWIGMLGGGGSPYLYGPTEGALYEGEIDQENERIVLRDDDRYEVESEETLGERIEEIGEEHDWEWLSEFARSYLKDDETGAETVELDGLSLRESEFQRRNIPEGADHDMAFTGSHTLEDESGRVHVVERWFYADLDGDRAVVTVDEDFLVAEPPREEERAGDANIVVDRERQFEVDLTREGVEPAVQLHGELEEWHESEIEWPETEA